MITLDDTLLIGRGTLRACYLHPQDETLIVKVAIPGRRGGEEANRKEFLSYKKISQRHEELEHISHCHGIVATSMGVNREDETAKLDMSFLKQKWDEMR